MLIEQPASKNSLANRKPIFGFGTNDAAYKTHYKNKAGKRFRCPYYSKWSNMLKRCYSEKCHKLQPTYEDCAVCDEWLVFSEFKAWMKEQDWKGKNLDKDLLIPGNKTYSPNACAFIRPDLNRLMCDAGSIRGEYPIGVSFTKTRLLFESVCYAYGKKVFLGRYKTAEEASKVYKKFKSKHILEVAEEYKGEPRLYEALQNHARLMLLQSD